MLSASDALGVLQLFQRDLHGDGFRLGVRVLKLDQDVERLDLQLARPDRGRLLLEDLQQIRGADPPHAWSPASWIPALLVLAVFEEPVVSRRMEANAGQDFDRLAGRTVIWLVEVPVRAWWNSSNCEEARLSTRICGELRRSFDESLLSSRLPPGDRGSLRVATSPAEKVVAPVGVLVDEPAISSGPSRLPRASRGRSGPAGDPTSDFADELLRRKGLQQVRAPPGPRPRGTRGSGLPGVPSASSIASALMSSSSGSSFVPPAAPGGTTRCSPPIAAGRVSIELNRLRRRSVRPNWNHVFMWSLSQTGA